jgi:hypothetical protein
MGPRNSKLATKESKPVQEHSEETLGGTGEASLIKRFNSWLHGFLSVVPTWIVELASYSSMCYTMFV